jgi:hypothetical protein
MSRDKPWPTGKIKKREEDPMNLRLAVLLLAVSWAMALCLTPAAESQSKLWVTSAGTKLHADKSATSSTVADVPVGAELTVISSQSLWYEVTTTTGKRGWVYRGKVSTTPPQGQQASDGSLFSALPGSGVQSQRADTSRSIRGLSPEAEEYAKRTNKPGKYQRALDAVLAMTVTPVDLEQFLKEGRIGEYAQ